MPDLISREYTVYLDDEEKQKYKDLQYDFVLDIDEDDVTVANAAVLSNKLSQLANGAIYTDESKRVIEIHNRKLEALEDIIEAANGKPLLVAYWFKHDLIRIKELLNTLGINYACLDSSESITKWNNKELEVGLIHPASAGHGLNLQEGGSTLVWFGLTWSLELYQQTNARLWRQGQSDSTVVIQHIITEGTIDEDILKALERKDKTQEALISAVKANIKGGKRR